MRVTVVPHTGHLPLAMRVPFALTDTSPVKSRFSLHFTQYAVPVNSSAIPCLLEWVSRLPTGCQSRHIPLTKAPLGAMRTAGRVADEPIGLWTTAAANPRSSEGQGVSTTPHPWIPTLPATVRGSGSEPDRRIPTVDSTDIREAWRAGGESAVRALLSRPDTARPTEVLRRWDQRVQVTGCPTLLPAITQSLAVAGLRVTQREQTDAISVFVGRISPTTIQNWTAERRVHLVVSPRPSSVRVGPLVVPGAGPCLRCLHLARTDHDPAWPRISEHLRRSPWPMPDPLLVHRAAGLAALAVTRYAESGASPLIGHTWTVTLHRSGSLR